MFDLDHRAALIGIEVGALMTGSSLLTLALTELFPLLRRLLRRLLSSNLLRFSLTTLVIAGAVATIDRWQPNPLAVLEIAALLGALGILGLVLTQLIPSLRHRTGRWPRSM